MTMELADCGLGIPDVQVPAMLAAEGALLVLAEEDRLSESEGQGQLGPTFQQAVAEAGGCGRRAAGMESAAIFDPGAAEEIDLYSIAVDREPDYRRGIDGAAARHGLPCLIVAEEAPPEAVGYPVPKDGALRATSTVSEGGEEEGEILIIADRPREMEEEPGIPGSTNDGGDPATGGGDTGMGGGGYGEPIGEEQNDCRDTKATEARDEINGRDDDYRRELGILVYRDSSGALRRSGIIEGTRERITLEDVLTAMQRDGISFEQVVGFVHNHDRTHYAAGDSLAERQWNEAINRYPSENDWNFADYMVTRGTGGAGGGGFALYVIDTKGEMREFHYGDKERYLNMTDSQKRVGVDLPDETEPGSCSE